MPCSAYVDGGEWWWLAATYSTASMLLEVIPSMSILLGYSPQGIQGMFLQTGWAAYCFEHVRRGHLSGLGETGHPATALSPQPRREHSKLIRRGGSTGLIILSGTAERYHYRRGRCAIKSLKFSANWRPIIRSSAPKSIFPQFLGALRNVAAFFDDPGSSDQVLVFGSAATPRTRMPRALFFSVTVFNSLSLNCWSLVYGRATFSLHPTRLDLPRRNKTGGAAPVLRRMYANLSLYGLHLTLLHLFSKLSSSCSSRMDHSHLSYHI